METTPDATSPPRDLKFRFKSPHTTTEQHNDRGQTQDGEDGDKEHARPHRKHHRRHHHRRHRSTSPGEFYTSSRRRPPATPSPPVSPNTSFRNSLFDALADDEGALYWESVYGQPLHTYSRHEAEAESKKGGLEAMSDEQYAEYVRARMWEKTHEGLHEEQQKRRRRAEGKRQEQEGRRKRRHRSREHEPDGYGFVFDMSNHRDGARERGTSDRTIEKWKGIWKRYLHSWDELNACVSAANESAPSEGKQKPSSQRRHLRSLIFWPVESGRRCDITREAVEKFMRNAHVASENSSSVNKITAESAQRPNDYLAVLKAERVRWHPDKIQQRYRSLGMEENVLKGVTTVFQIIDALFIEEKG